MRHNQLAVAEFLMDQNININACDNEGNTALHYACCYCIVLNYHTGTQLNQVDYFPGSPMKVEQQAYIYTTHNTLNQLVNQSINQQC